MTKSEYILTDEYSRQKYIAYTSCKRKVKSMGEYGHKKAMEHFNKKYGRIN